MSIAQFKSLYQKYPNDAYVKLFFTSNSNNIEHLWAQVENIKDDELNILLITPPVTHKGHLDRSYICTFEDIEDWQVTDNEDNIYGGYTQRAMFKIARKKGIEIPQELLKTEKQYIS